MADDGGILGLLGRMNDPAALYGGALSDERTRQAMAGRGLLAMAGSFADSAMPTRMPTPFGAVLGHAASAAGSSEDTIMESRLRNAQAQQAMATTGLLNQVGPAYELLFKELKRQQDAAAAAAGGGIPTTPPPGTTPGTVGPGGPAPTGPISPDLVTWHANNVGLNPLIAHTALDIESGYGKNLGNEKSPSNTGAFQRAKADAPGGQNDTIDNQVKFGVGDLVSERNQLRTRLGRDPTNAEVYLAHQQGPGGAAWLITHPNEPAGNVPGGPGDAPGPVRIANNGGERFVNAPASAFVAHWENLYNGREAKFAPGTLTPPVPPGGGIAAGPPPPGGLLSMPDSIAGKMNEPIPGIAAPTAAAPGTPAAAAAAAPRSAGEALVAANQAIQAAGGLPRLQPGLPQMADASGQVPPGPTLVPGGKAIPGLLQPPGAGPPPQVAAAPPGQPQSLIPPPQPAPVPPPAQAAPAAAPMAGPPAAPPPLNLPMPPGMPGGMGPPVQATPLQMIAQGIAGLSSLTGHPAPDFVQKLAGQPVEMQMEAYKAYVGAQANQLTEKYKKEIEVASAGTISYLTRMGQLPGDIALRTAEQELNLRKEMLTQHGLARTPDGKGWQIDPVWLNAQAQKAAIAAQATAERELVDVPVADDPANPNGPKHTQKMTRADAAAYVSGRGPGTPGVVPGTSSGPAPGVPGMPLLGPEQEAEQKARGTVLGKEYEQVAADATAAQKAKPYLLAIEHAIQIHNTTGAGDAARLEAWKAVQGAATTFGFSIPEGLQDWIAKGEIVSKGSTHLGFQLSRSLGGGSHTSEVIIQQAVKNNPSLGNSPQGNQDLLNLLNAIGDRSVAERKFYDDYWGKKKTHEGASTAFNEQNPWEVTMSQFAPYQAAKMDKATYDKLPPGVKVLRSDGSGTFIKPGAQ